MLACFERTFEVMRDAQRLAEDGYMVVVFLDELTTVPPTTQAAMLRLLTENVCGELSLPDYEPGKGGVVYLCASNAVEWAAGGPPPVRVAPDPDAILEAAAR